MSEDTFTRIVHLDHIGDDGKVLKIGTSPDERAIVAERLDLNGLDSFSAELNVERDGPAHASATGVIIEGNIHASGTQICVVSLEPVPFSIEAPIRGFALPSDSSELEREDLTLEDDEIDILGEIENGQFDAAEIVIQQLSLELDPFPRAEGVEPEWLGDPEDETESDTESPFAALAKLKNTLK